MGERDKSLVVECPASAEEIVAAVRAGVRDAVLDRLALDELGGKVSLSGRVASVIAEAVLRGLEDEGDGDVE